MLISKIDVTQADLGPHDRKFRSKLTATLSTKNYCFLFKHMYDRNGFPYENIAENVFI